MLIAFCNKITGADLRALSGAPPVECPGFSYVASTESASVVTTSWLLSGTHSANGVSATVTAVNRQDPGGYQPVAFRLQAVEQLPGGTVRLQTEFNLSSVNDDHEFAISVSELADELEQE